MLYRLRDRLQIIHMKIKTSSPQQTHALAADLARKTSEGTIYALVGSLGTGKTEFVRGFVAALSPDVCVSSPSFTLINTYNTGSFVVHHFDFYRLKSKEELVEIGFYEYINSDAVCFIEWADMFPEVLPENSIYIRFYEGNDNCRVITVVN